MKKTFFALLAAAAALLPGCGKREAPPSDGTPVIRIGHFPNMTHVQALVAHHLSRQGKGWFEERLGVRVEWFIYNAGPSAMEAFFAKSIEMTYVGPSPAINAYVRSRGEEVRIISGAVNGGSALVVQPDSKIETGLDFKGKRIATPQLGNTQDVACRAWLKEQGLKVTVSGGDVSVVPAANPEILSLFSSKKVDAAWTVEPWVSRLEREAGARVFLEEEDEVTTVLASSARFLKNRPELAQKVVQAHRELTEWIKANPQEAQRMVVAELEAETRSKISPELIAAAWGRIILTDKIDIESLRRYVKNATDAGLLKNVPELDRLVPAP